MTRPGYSAMILDGGLATELEARGYDISGSLWSARLLRTSPEAIEQLHYDFYNAGADCATTASYQASYEGFAGVGLEADETTRLLRLSVELAQSTRSRYQRNHPEDRRELFVAASVGPYGAILHDGSEYRGARPRLDSSRGTPHRWLLPRRAEPDRAPDGSLAAACHAAGAIRRWVQVGSP